MATNSKLLTSEEVAQKLSVKLVTLEAWRCRGEGPAFVKVGRLVRYPDNLLDAWLDSRTRTQAGAAA